MFTIDNFFSPEESRFYIDQAENLSFESIDWEYAKSYRDCVRVVAKSDQLATTIWSRLMKHTVYSDFAGVQPFGFGTRGTWAPIGINPVFRFSKYLDGGHFSPHRDGGFVINDNLRSIFTILVFLNDGYVGGDTLFFNDNCKSNDTLEEIPCFRIVPKAGTALIFNHDCRHAGEKVVAGTKYIFRTDIIFERIDLPLLKGNENFYLEIPEYHEAEKLYQLSIDLQKSGDCEGSTIAYLKALEMHAKVPSVVNFGKSKSIENSLSALPRDIWLQIVCYLDLPDFGQISQLFKSSSEFIDASCWQLLYKKYFPESIYPSLSATIQHISNAINSGRPILTESDDAAVLGLMYLDWRSLFRYRLLAESHFQVLFVDIGSYETKFSALGLDPLIQKRHSFHFKSIGPAQKQPSKIGLLESIVYRSPGHYWGSGSGFISISVGNQDNYYLEDVGIHPYMESTNKHYIQTQALESIIVYLLENMFEAELSPRQHPLLLPLPSFVSIIEKKTIYMNLFADLRLPYIGIVSSAHMVLHAHGMQNSTSIVACLGARYLWTETYITGQSVLADPVSVRLVEHSKTSSQIVAELITELIIETLILNPDYQTTLCRNIILTGGRINNSNLIDKIFVELLKSIKNLGLACGEPRLIVSEEPQMDVIRGCINFMSHPLAKSSFLCIDSLPKLQDELLVYKQEMDSAGSYIELWPEEWEFTLRNVLPDMGLSSYDRMNYKKPPNSSRFSDNGAVDNPKWFWDESARVACDVVTLKLENDEITQYGYQKSEET
ncbi:hypothetical protein HK096_004085 [Nowakowskiella sp. JEL0078]|nr:hypothetical protein HK096_004085 [Nowakowskiella sp. JEL0078]